MAIDIRPGAVFTNNLDGSISFRYRNHRGDVSVRRVYPRAIKMEENVFHREQWLLEATDAEKEEERSFAFRDILPMED